MPKIYGKFKWGHPSGDAKYQWGRLNSAIFDEYLTVSHKWCKVGTLLLQKANRPMTSSDP